jgi:hypothetical protein
MALSSAGLDDLSRSPVQPVNNVKANIRAMILIQAVYPDLRPLSGFSITSKRAAFSRGDFAAPTSPCLSERLRKIGDRSAQFVGFQFKECVDQARAMGGKRHIAEGRRLAPPRPYMSPYLRGPQMSDVVDQAVSHLSLTNDPARVAAVVSSDQRFAYFGTAAFAIRLLDWIRKSPAACRCHCGVWRTSLAPTRCCFRNSPVFEVWRSDAGAVRGRAWAEFFSWVKPKLVAQINFAEWTGGNCLRHPSYQDCGKTRPPTRLS